MLSPSEEANLSAEQLPGTGGCQLLPAILLAVKEPLLVPFFSLFLALRAGADTKGCAYAIDLADTHAQVKPLA